MRFTVQALFLLTQNHLFTVGIFKKPLKNIKKLLKY